MTEMDKRLLRRVRRREAEGLSVFLRHHCEFRAARRLVRAGLLHAAVSKVNLFGGEWAFRELAVATAPDDLRRRYLRLLPKAGP